MEVAQFILGEGGNLFSVLFFGRLFRFFLGLGKFHGGSFCGLEGVVTNGFTIRSGSDEVSERAMYSLTVSFPADRHCSYTMREDSRTEAEPHKVNQQVGLIQ